jgi:hypothetical protein
MANRTIKKSLRAFVASWGSSVASRLRAAKIYADAANAGTTETKAQFWALKGFEQWTGQQWSLLYFIGSGVILPEFIDARNISVALQFNYKHIRYEMQQQIFKHGLKIANINGTLRTIEFKRLHEKHINQVFKEDGTERTISEQVEWIKSQQRDNIEALSNGSTRIRHACIITPEKLYEFLCSEKCPLGAAALMAAANAQARRGNN